MAHRLLAAVVLPLVVLGCTPGPTVMEVYEEELGVVQVSDELAGHRVWLGIDAARMRVGETAQFSFKVTQLTDYVQIQSDPDEEYSDGLQVTGVPVTGLDVQVYFLEAAGFEDTKSEIVEEGGAYLVEHTFRSAGDAYLALRVAGMPGEAGFKVLVEQ